AVIWYDYFLTFPAEVEYIWKKRWRLSTILYLCCRHQMLGNVLYMLGLAKVLTQGGDLWLKQFDTVNNGLNCAWPFLCYRCDHWYRVIAALSVLGRAAVIIVFAARTYAVYGRSIYVLIPVGALGLAVVILDIVRHLTGVKSSVVLIHPSMPSLSEVFDTLLSVLVLSFELVCLVLTAWRCGQEIHATGGFQQAPKKSLFVVMLQQGILYFALVSMITMGAVILNFDGSYYQRMLNAFILPLSCTLTARFLLHLREWDDRAVVLEGKTQAASAIATMSDWKAAAVSAMSMDDFGSDPVAVAVEKQRRGGTHSEKQLNESDTGTQRSEVTVNVGGDVLDDGAVSAGAKVADPVAVKRREHSEVEQVERSRDDHPV
ncbi:hypothetical protein BDV98DRAFT_514051, partial [Pterulicium gracile]